MGFVTPPIHFGRVILCVLSSPFLVSILCDVCLGWYVRLLCSPQYVLHTISLKNLDLAPGEICSMYSVQNFPICTRLRYFLLHTFLNNSGFVEKERRPKNGHW